MYNNCQNIQYIKERIYEISDINMQKKLWLNQDNDTGLISSYAELMSSLFDDLDFDFFIDFFIVDNGFELSLIDKFNKLRDLLNNYNEKLYDKEIVEDPEWIQISFLAKDILNEWN